ncbi:MAG: NDP-sugar synthase [Aigarchaeota archaeon]|nr:NDP-sugar synthase [Aigarchaeota archaeon]
MKAEDLTCFIPVGGMAKRLRPLTCDISKPCIRFMNRALIEFPILALASQGVRNFILGEQGYINYTGLFDQFGDGAGFSAKYGINPRIHIMHQPNVDDLGSADSYRLNVEYYDVEGPVIVVQGDNIFDVNLEDLMRWHEKKDSLMTIALFKTKNVEEYGVADVDDDMRIKKFVEKPTSEKAPSNLINAGIYLLAPEMRKIVASDEVKRILDERKRLDFGYDLIPYLVDKGFPVYGYEISTWYDVGNPKEYLRAMVEILKGSINIKMPERIVQLGRNVWIQEYDGGSNKLRDDVLKKYRDGKIVIEGAALIGKHTRIGERTVIQDSCIDNYCIIGENVRIERSAIMDAVKIGDNARIIDSIIGRKSIIESYKSNPTHIVEYSVIGNAVRIREGCSLIGTKVNPYLTIPPGMKYVNKYIEDYKDVVQLAE